MNSVTVVVPMTIRRRGGRKQIIGPDGAPLRVRGNVTETRGDPAVVKALARAFRWRRMLKDGRYASIRDLAAAEKVDASRIARLLRLTLLAPDLIAGLLDGGGAGGQARTLLREELPTDWAAQRSRLGGR